MELEVLKEAIESVLMVYEKEIHLDSVFLGDLGADSIDLMQIFQICEERLGISTDPAKAEEVVTVQDALNLILEAKGNES